MGLGRQRVAAQERKYVHDCIRINTPTHPLINSKTASGMASILTLSPA
jgi:hypothetical protein